MLKRHVQFFDNNSDGLIDGREIYEGLRLLRLSPLTSWVGSWFIPLLLAKRSGGTHGKINIAGISHTTHQPDDSGGFTDRPNFPLTQDTYTKEDIRVLIRQRGGKPRRLFFALEWDPLFASLKKFRVLNNEKGEDVVTREEIQQVFDGTLFYRLTGRPVPV